MTTVFVLGTGRCGSTLVHELLTRHPDTVFLSNVDDRLGRTTALTPHNGAVYRRLPPTTTRKGRLRFAPTEGYRLLDRHVSPAIVDPARDLTAGDAMPWLVARLQRLFAPLHDTGATVVHKLTGWPRVGLLRVAFPDARFVHVVRDGRAVAASWVQMPWWRGHRGPEGWHFGPLPTEAAQRWEESGRSMPVLAALGWELLLHAFDDARRTDPAAPWLELRYEDLVVQPRAAVAQLTRFAGLGAHRAMDQALAHLEVDASRLDGYRRALAPDDRTAIETAIGPTLRRWGYDVAPTTAAGGRVEVAR